MQMEGSELYYGHEGKYFLLEKLYPSPVACHKMSYIFELKSEMAMQS